MPPRDDLGYPVDWRARPAGWSRWFPSLTESVAVTRPDALAGATIWCTHPADLDVPRVRGTKNPDLAAIAALDPDIVLANQEENRRVDVERLRAAGITGLGDRDQDPGRGDRVAAPDVHGRARLAGTAVAGRGRAGVARPRPGTAHPGGDPDLARPVDGGRLGHLHRRPGRPPRPGQRLRRPIPSATRTSTSTTWPPAGPSSSSCPTSPTRSPPTTARRCSPASGWPWSKAGASPGTARPWSPREPS